MRKRIDMKEICRIIMLILLVGVVAVNIKSIFTDFDIDSEYAMAMSYRMLQGDRMFLQMWEPHQTSAFLCTLLMGIYLKVVGSTTGCAIFLHLLGVLIQGVVGVAVYLFLRKRINILLAQLITLFFLTVRPKDIVFPEFSNMQIWFSVLLFVCLLIYLENGKKRWLIATSVCLCLEIISYPSCMLVFLGVGVVIGIYGKDKLRDILIFSAACALQGSMYVLFFVLRMGVSTFWECVGKIVAADTSHSTGGYYSGENFFGFFQKSLLEVAICLLLALILNVVARKCLADWKFVREHNFFWSGLLIFSGCYTVMDGLYALIFRDKFSYNILFLLLIFGATSGYKYCTKVERRIVVTGGIISLGSFIATLMLTNLDFLSVVKYLILAVMVSLIPMSRIFDQKIKSDHLLFRWFVLFCFCFIVVFRRGMIVKTLDGLPSNLFDLGGIIKYGPAMGIVSDYMGAYVENSTYEEWQNFVNKGENILLVGGSNVSTMAYLYDGANTSAASTICTPTYDEQLLEYWEKNPDKKPEVIVVQCWYGDLRIDEDSWIMQWINEEFQPSTYVDGKYWRYYRIDETVAATNE